MSPHESAHAHDDSPSRDDHGHGHEHDHSHGHGHGDGNTSSRKLAAVSLINVVGFVVELAGGLAFGSVALISDAIHMLFDALAYVMAFAAAYVAEHYGEGERWTYGLHRLEPFAAFVNGLLLLPMVGFILWESYHRFLEPVAIGTAPTLAIATGGLLVNVGSVAVLHGDAMSLNERGAFYHLLGDAGGSVAVIVSVLVVEWTGHRIVDPITAALIAAVVAWSAVRVLRGSGEIFFLKTPLESDEIRGHIRELDGVDRVDDFHAWQICSQITVATVHLETGVETMTEAESVVDRVHDELAHHGVDHATVEVSPSYTDRDVYLDTHCH
ncbi:cation diffusion facilitator family transporter [Natrinema salifodinae]|uniref:Cobalt-zinc-cadmium efflux system protein n=1 Tax=Natrinema salifodinae TaxID=1202768 RepID=A0A1I0Q4V3_9EURY|nr:cation diffusion facilitator family transporter [Natrinema salifodinae]SEW21923.1 cobalt-zinc-cadmium efflux system protein [Natrinema salifodinae]